MSKDGHALYYASSECKACKVTVLRAVTQYGYALEYASPEIKADREVWGKGGGVKSRPTEIDVI